MPERKRRPCSSLTVRPTTGRACSPFSKARELKGVEWVGDDFYARTVHLDESQGWIRVTPGAAARMRCCSNSRHSLTPVLPRAAQPRARAVRSECAAGHHRTHLGKDKVLAGRGQAQSWPACAGRFQRIRDGRARHHWSTGHGEGGYHDCLPFRAKRLASPSSRHIHSSIASRRQPERVAERERRRHCQAGNRQCAQQEHHCARSGAGFG